MVDTHDHPLRNRVDCLLQLPEQPQITAAEKQCVHLERAAEQHLQIMQEAVLLFCTKRVQIADLRGGNRLTECADELHQRLTALVLDRSDSIHLQRTIQRRPLRLRQLLPHMLVEALQKTAVQLRRRFPLEDAEDAVPAAHFQSARNLCRRQFRFVQHPLEALRKSKMLVHAPPPSAVIRALTRWSAFLPSLTHNFILPLANNLSSILATDFHFR